MPANAMLDVIILAAGRGTRMRSPIPKVLHPLAGRPLLSHVLDTAHALNPEAVHVVVGHGADEVISTLNDTTIQFHQQVDQLGTGHATAQALPSCNPDNLVLVLFGDVPLISVESLKRLVAAAGPEPAMLAARLDDPSGYGRVVRDAAGGFVSVVEHKDATPQQLSIAEVNTGVLAAPANLLTELLARIDNNNAQSEYYLPDVLALARADGRAVAVELTDDPVEMAGVNDRLQLEELERVYQQRTAESLLRNGVSISDRRRFDVRGHLECGENVVIDVNVVFEGHVVLGDGVRVGPNCVIKNAHIGPDCDINAFSHIEDATLGSECSVGPYARLRPGTELGDQARIGNFVETKKAVFGRASKANHLAYIGDTTLGDGCNIGAGTITCNYDGVNKHQTIIGDRVFVGSNSTLVAPVEIQNDGFVAAGSVITKTVPTDELAVGRARQRNISGWQRPVKPGTGSTTKKDQ